MSRPLQLTIISLYCVKVYARQYQQEFLTRDSQKKKLKKYKNILYVINYDDNKKHNGPFIL